MKLREHLAAANAVAVTGSRALHLGEMTTNLKYVLTMLPERTPLYVGCASGVDQYTRLHRAGAQVLEAKDHGPGIVGIVRRSQALARKIAATNGGLIVGLPYQPCPTGLVPSRHGSACFNGSGSGTWATLAYAIGLGCKALIWIDHKTNPPEAWALHRLQWLETNWYILEPKRTDIFDPDPAFNTNTEL